MPEAIPAAPATPPAPAATPAPGATPPVPAPADPAVPAAAPSEKPPAQDPAIAARFAALTKKEREIVAAQQKAKAELQAEREKLQSDITEAKTLRERIAAIEAAESRAKLDPEPTLKKLFGDNWYDYLTEYRVSGGKAPADVQVKDVEERLSAKMEAELKARDEKFEADRKARLEAAQKEAEERNAAIIARFQDNIAQHVQSNLEACEYISLFGQQALVYQVIQETYKKTEAEGAPRVLSIPEACEQVEKYLEGEISKGTKAKKFKGPEAKKEAEAPTPPTPTLTNHTAVASPSNVRLAPTEAERVSRARAAAEAVIQKRKQAAGQ